MSFRTRERVLSRDFKKGIDARESRRRREEVTASLRKNARMEQQRLKRRMGTLPAGDENDQLQTANTDAMLTPEEVEQHLSNLGNIAATITNPQSTAQQVLDAVIIIRRLLSVNKRPPITPVVATGVVGTLIKMLQAPHVSDKLRFEALWALTNVASGTSEQCQVLVQEGALPAFVAMTKSSNAECREQAVWAIGNVAGDSEALRDETLRAGCMQAVMRLINPHNPSSVGMLRNVTWTLSNMCRGKKPLPPFEYVRHAIPAMTWLLNYDDSEVIQDAAWGLSYVSDEPGDDNYKLDVFVKQEGLLQRLAWLLENYQKQDILVVPVLRAIGNVLTGNDQQTDAVLQHGVTEALLKLLRHPKRNIRKETAWALSNITAGQPHQIEQVLGNQALVTELSRLLRSGDVVVQREAAWTIANACTCGNNRQLRFISGKEEIVSAMSDALGCGDRAIIKVICEAIVALIKFGNSQGDETFTELLEATGGLDNLEELQHHSSEDVYQSVASVFQQLQDSGNVELDQEEIATDGQTFSFGATEIGTADFGSTASTWDF